MRPASIVKFERIFLASLALGVVNAALSYQDSLKLLQADPATAQMGFGSGLLITVLLFGIGIPVLLWFLIARRASNVAKWILVVITGLGVLMTIPSLPLLMQRGMTPFLGTIILTVLQVIAITFLFRSDAVAWLTSKGAKGPVDTNIFS